MSVDAWQDFLEIDDIELRGWIELDLAPLWSGPRSKGASTDVGHANGALPNPLRVAETTYRLTGYLYGDQTPDGDPVNTDQGRLEQLEANIDYLRANVCFVPGGAVTRTCVWHRVSGDELTGQVQVQRDIGFAPDSLACARIVLTVTVHAGELTEVGS